MQLSVRSGDRCFPYFVSHEGFSTHPQLQTKPAEL